MDRAGEWDAAVQIAGVGAQTAIGRSAAATAAAVRAGFSDFVRQRRFRDRTGEPVVAARARWLPDDLGITERLLGLAVPAAREALENVAGDRSARRVRIAIVLGFPSARPGISGDLGSSVLSGLVDALREELSRRHLEVVETQCLPCGHAAGSMALESGWRRIRAGEIDCCLAGGVDSYLNAETLGWLDGCGQLHSIENKWGLIPGEGAGFCLLGRADLVRESGGSLVSAAVARESKLIKTRTVCTGEGLTAAFKAALGALPAGAQIDQTLCDLNGEPYRADELGFAIVRARKALRDPSALLVPASSWGDVGAASGPLFAALAVEAGRRGVAKGSSVLLSTSSELGERAVAVLHVPEQHRDV
ncbi:MAG: beta-ketoacyl synthase N-terminal-like domain-containing protein [Minicystis sp.]